MESPILTINGNEWQRPQAAAWQIAELEVGHVWYFHELAFNLTQTEQLLLKIDIRHPKVRNISLNNQDLLKGVQKDMNPDTAAAVAAMLKRFRFQAQQLIESLLPRYAERIRLAPTSYRPEKVETRQQSWRADDRRLHVDAFPSRPNQGERILRVFTNINPDGVPRVWRIGESFENVAQRFLPKTKKYRPWQAQLLQTLSITKSRRSEYDHLMLQIHDAMKANSTYQQQAQQITMPFPPGCSWVCFSDQTSHAVISGQYLLEQTFHLPTSQQYQPATSPIEILTRLRGHSLI